MIQINNLLGKIRRWLLLCTVLLLTVVLVTAGSDASLNMVHVENSLRELLSLLVQICIKRGLRHEARTTV
jgi:hypothetical protein